MAQQPWRVSLHGGHSGEFCEHAEGSLREVLEAAVAAGYHTFGVSEHAPRSEARFLYPAEVAKGFDVARLHRDFEAYARSVDELAEEFRYRLVVLRGFECEVVPSRGYHDQMLAHRRRFGFDFMVGSVHHVNEILIDGERAEFERARAACGGLEALAIRYYQTVAEMVSTLRPEVVGHLDLIRKNAGPEAALDSAGVRRAAERALDVVREFDCILDLNTAGYRKGIGTPYPAPWLLRQAHQMEIGFCFGDDSHRPSEVGAGLDDARNYLLENGVSQIAILTRRHDSIVRMTVPLT